MPRSDRSPTTSTKATSSPPARRRAPGANAVAASTQRPARLFAAVYFVLAVIGAVGTWYFNLAWTGTNYLADWFANGASSSAAVDIIVVLAVAIVFFMREGRRLGWKVPLLLLLIPLSIVVAVACALPLFMGLRELRLARDQRPTTLVNADADA